MNNKTNLIIKYVGGLVICIILLKLIGFNPFEALIR